MLIKICGIKRKEDIQYVNILKPDFIGFVFAKSKRQVDMIEAKKLIALLNENIKIVGVFVNKSIHELMQMVNYLELDVIQLHGDEDKAYIKEIRNLLKKKHVQIWKSICISDKRDIKKIHVCTADKVLLDHGKGGTGVSFSWEIIRNKNMTKPIILAGGLNSENIKKAIEIVKPYAVDVSSGVEINGVKNFNKINEFIKACR
ncbi:phosphoribosylanthranilate isomerase [Clostridium tetanomorphum]|uniref:N-(5'-phosphoribosyl)anthranilate isomerase n=1 Tax=Clostridium tetanomorphum TaxID=1553 RepID=A0A923E7Z2_CLOTT|nr:phosphoribosylanthranilate isomerase [Clostridium tetanomorphum]MBC2396801.1 phosphoribosylanthranilate isomerase [Clostridium tetanomorphum]